MIGPDLIERLLYEGESVTLDFKEEQYPFAEATDPDKSKLLKDILAFANAWRRTDAFILIGVRDGKGSRGSILGIETHLDDASVQQFVNSKTNQPITFAYIPMQFEGKAIAVIHIPIQARPVYLNDDYRPLVRHAVYVRRGSSTATVLPEEVARMGRESVDQPSATLEVFFGNPRTRTEVKPQVLSRVLVVPAPGQIPEFSPRRTGNPLVGIPMGSPRGEYNRELVKFTRLRLLVSPVFLAIRNGGRATAQDVRLEMWIPGADQGVVALDKEDYPAVPEMYFNSFASLTPHWQRRAPDSTVERVGDKWLVRATAAKIHPQAIEWFDDPVFVGASESREIECTVSVFADNLAQPHEQTLIIPVSATSENADLDRVLELEQQRFRASEEFRRLSKAAEDEGFDIG